MQTKFIFIKITIKIIKITKLQSKSFFCLFVWDLYSLFLYTELQVPPEKNTPTKVLIPIKNPSLI